MHALYMELEMAAVPGGGGGTWRAGGAATLQCGAFCTAALTLAARLLGSFLGLALRLARLLLLCLLGHQIQQLHLQQA